MAYYLTIKENGNNYKILDVNSLDEFIRLSKYKGNSYSLEEIDGFTSSFDNEIVLKRRLYDFGIITTEDITKEISIRRKNKNELVKVMYEPVYKYNKKFVDDFFVRAKLLELQNDRVFLNKLLNHYRNNYRQEHLAKIRAILGGYRGTDINMYEALSSFFKTEVYEVIPSTGETKVKYKSLHDLGMFIYNYLSKKDKSELEIETCEMVKKQCLEELKESLIAKPVCVKKRVKKQRKELDGQMSFYDF